MVCEVEGCDKEDERSLSMVRIGDALSKENLAVRKDAKIKKGRKSGKIKLCKEHYRKVKKHIKKKEKIERLRWS
ncbi:MAG: hypothetical protein ACFFD4_01640 [Candidatus Odinarchaeota archaeon]